MERKGIGELTSKGMRQHYELGQKLKEKYILNTKFLSQIYNSSEIYARSSDKNRCISSAQSLLYEHIFNLDWDYIILL